MNEELLKSALNFMSDSMAVRNKDLEIDLALARAQIVTLQDQLKSLKEKESSDG